MSCGLPRIIQAFAYGLDPHSMNKAHLVSARQGEQRSKVNLQDQITLLNLHDDLWFEDLGPVKRPHPETIPLER